VIIDLHHLDHRAAPPRHLPSAAKAAGGFGKGIG
jgi:hypothetical protein